MFSVTFTFLAVITSPFLMPSYSMILPWSDAIKSFPLESLNAMYFGDKSSIAETYFLNSQNVALVYNLTTRLLPLLDPVLFLIITLSRHSPLRIPL